MPILRPRMRPMVSEQDEIPFIMNQDKYSLVTDENISRRQIFLVDEIVDSTFEQVKNLYDSLLEESLTAPIHFVIGTTGGDVRSMLGIMNLITLSQTPCYTYLLGETCSAGSWIYLSGHKRFCPKTSLVSLMLHPMEWNKVDSLGNQKSHIDYVNKLSNKLIDFTIQRTLLTKENLEKLATNETAYFVGDEIFECGIATDELTTSAFWALVPSKKKPRKSKAKGELILDLG